MKIGLLNQYSTFFPHLASGLLALSLSGCYSMATPIVPSLEGPIKTQQAKEKLYQEATKDCEASDFIAFASEDKTYQVFARNSSLRVLKSFDNLKAAQIKTCQKYLDTMLDSKELELFVRHNYSKPEPRSFPVFTTKGDDDNDSVPEIKDYWAHRYTHAGVPKKKGLSGEGIRIGILDGGVDPDTPQFKAQIKKYEDFVYSHILTGRSEHGTFVSGIINRVVPKAGLYEYRIHDAVGLNYMTDVLEAMDMVIADNIDVINNSWGLSDPPELEGMTWEDGNKVLAEAVERVAKSGTIVVTSAGNDSYYGPITLKQQPNGSPYAISVGAINNHGEIVYFSDLDAHLFAPGYSVYSTKNSKEFDYWNGTSFSSPFVTAAAAVTLDYGRQHGYNFNYRQVREILVSSGKMESTRIVNPEGKEETSLFKSLDYKRLVDFLELMYP